MACAEAVYRPRDAEHAVLHQGIAHHLDDALRAAAEVGEGACSVPRFAGPASQSELKSRSPWLAGPRETRPLIPSERGRSQSSCPPSISWTFLTSLSFPGP